MKHILQNTLSILSSNEKKKLCIFIALNVFISIIDIASLALLVFLISFYTQGGPHAGFVPNLQGLFDKDSIIPVAIFLFLFIAKSFFGYLVLAAQYRYVYSVASRISEANLLKYLEGSYEDYVHTDSSVYVRKILHQPIEFCHYVLAGIQQIITESILSFFTIVAILVFNAKLFLLLLFVLVPPVVLIAYFTKRKLKQARANAETNSEKTLQHLHEALAGYIESNIYDKSIFFAERFSRDQQRMARFLADIQTTQGAPARLVEVFAVLGLFVLILANKFWANSAAVDIVNIGAFMAAAYKIIPGIVKISNISGQIKTYEYTINDLVKNKYVAKQLLGLSEKGIESVVYQQVSFSRDNKTILDGFDFEIRSGDFIGMSGPSGRGKTTFVNLLLGFLQEGSGAILINGLKVAAEERQHYWTSIAYVQQRPFLIHDTVAANIALSHEHVDEERLNQCINGVGLGEFVEQFTERTNKVIAESGKNISGGQRQRIAIARALYKNADLIILDEPFSELDAQSEQELAACLKKLAEKGKMIIMITHNKENLRFCNKIYIIE